MTDPSQVEKLLQRTEDAFHGVDGRSTFEPDIDSSPDAPEGKVQVQKACRLLDLAHEIDEIDGYYTAVLESSFVAIEHTLQGYLLALTGAEEHDLMDHSSPYDLAEGQVPLENDTLQRVSRLYDENRTSHYYGTTVTTQAQAENTRELARELHLHVVGFDQVLGEHCICSY